MNLTEYIDITGGLKIKVNPEQSEQIQKICFENGICWFDSDKEVLYTDEPYFYIYKDKITFGCVDWTFNEHEHTEISAQKFIRLFEKKFVKVFHEDDFCDHSDELKLATRYFTKQGGIMQKLTARLKRVLNKDLRAIYQIGWIDGDLELTEKGARALLELLFDKNEEALAKLAREEIKKLEDK